jgi:ketosteroid isomerase-like protein
MRTRTVLIVGATVVAVGVGILVGLLAVPGGSSASSASEEQMQRDADSWQINELQRSFHEALTLKDIDLMMSLWAPNAAFTSAATTAVGKEEIREFWLTKSATFKPESNWIALTVSYEIRISVNGDRGTLYYECHFVNPDTKEVEASTAGDGDVTKIDGRWLITNLAAASATLGP